MYRVRVMNEVWDNFYRTGDVAMLRQGFHGIRLSTDRILTGVLPGDSDAGLAHACFERSSDGAHLRSLRATVRGMRQMLLNRLDSTEVVPEISRMHFAERALSTLDMLFLALRSVDQAYTRDRLLTQYRGATKHLHGALISRELDGNKKKYKRKRA